jgi:signal transduction histidine kinase
MISSTAALPEATSDHVATVGGRLHGCRMLLARAAWLVVAALVGAVVVLALPGVHAALATTGGGGLPPDAFAAYELGLLGLVIAVFGGVAILLVWRRPDERMALFSALALVTFPVYAFHLIPLHGTTALALLWHWVGSALAVVGVIGLTLLLYLFPDGRFVPRWTRWLILPWLLAEGIRHVVPGTRWDYSGWPALPFVLVLLAVLGPAVGVMFYRYRCVSNPVQRQQTKWFAWGATLAVGMAIGTTLWTYLLAPPALQRNLLVIAVVDTARVAAVLLVPLSIGLAVARYRLWASDLLVNRTLVYGALTASVIALYVLIVGTLSILLAVHRGMLITLVAIGVIAALVQPLRVRLQRGVNRLLYGERDDPYQVLSHLGRHLEEILAPEAVLPVVVETVARALKLPYVAVALRQERGPEVVAARGTPVAAPIVLPLVYQQEPVGQLLLAPRAGSDRLSPADERLFAVLTRQVAVAVHAAELSAAAVRLTGELRQARTRLVTLREEGRRRLRRDLHDGLGPALACIALQAETARDLVQSDPAQAEAALTDLAAQAQAAIADIRRVVYELRPPALDDLGLVGAVRAHACRLHQQALCLRVDTPEDLPPLPAAVEVAAYRIVQEALTNVVRHAAARTCTVRLRLDGALSDADGAACACGTLCVEVIDDGCGLPAVRQAGVGLQSMRERAAELGGVCVIEAAATGGTRVAARLPIVLPDSPDALADPRGDQ